RPTTSPLSGILTIFKGTTAVATSTAGAASFSYTIPAGGDGTYYARVTASGSPGGFLSQYLLSMGLVRAGPPTVTAGHPPAEGTTSSAVIDRFTVTFSEDMAAATVNDTSNLQLVDTQHNVTYTLASFGYTSGLTASYRVTDGPLQPGTYQLTLRTGLTDKSG